MSDSSSDADGETQRKRRRSKKKKKDSKKPESGKKKYKRYVAPFLEEGRYRPSEYKIPKKPKPDGAPKRPLSSYFLFAKEERATVKEQNPDLDIYEITKLIAENWNHNVDEDDKKKFEDEAIVLREDYKTARNEYEKS
eukprot:UN01566